METDRGDCEIDVKMTDILDYVRDSKRPIREGLLLKESNHIVCLGYEKQTACYTYVKGYVLQSSHPDGKPHEVLLNIHKFNYQLWDITCSCKAGKGGKCKHAIACLFQLHQFRSLEYLTCTDALQAWGHSKTEKTSLWGARPIRDLCCVRTPKKVACSDFDTKIKVLDDAFSRLLKANPASAIRKHVEGRFSNPIQFQTEAPTNPYAEFCSPDDLQNVLQHDQETAESVLHFNNSKEESFYNCAVKKSPDQIVKIAIETSSQRNNAWKLHRSIRITASTCYSLFTYTKNTKPDWVKKISNYTNPKCFETKHMRYGKVTEEQAFKCYKLKRNCNVKKTGFIISLTEPWLGASPDGLDINSKTILEIKCPASGKDHDLAWVVENCDATKRYLKSELDDQTGLSKCTLNPNHAYYAQVQVNMFILNCKKADFIIYSSKEDNFLPVEVDFNPNFMETLINSLRDVYVTKMLPALIEKQ